MVSVEQFSSIFAAPLGHKLKVCRNVSIVEERLLSAVAALRYAADGSTDAILDEPLVAGVAHVEIIDSIDSDRGDSTGVEKACVPPVVARGRAAVLQQ